MVNLKRAIEICKVLNEWDRLKDHAPEELSCYPDFCRTKKDKLVFNFLIGSINYGMKAKILYKKILEWLNENSYFMDLTFASKMSIRLLEREFRKLGLRYPKEYGKNWIFNLKFSHL